MNNQFWHTKKSKQFLKNIDTFYYAIFFEEDFTPYTQNTDVINLRKQCENLKKLADGCDFDFGKEKYRVSYMPGSFSCYGVRFCKPEYFDFFLAPMVHTDTTPHAIMQLRSRPLWEEGIYAAFEESMHFVELFAQAFHLTVKEVRENRCDFACHSNYLNDPERFFEKKHFVKMWIGSVGRNDREKVKEYNNHITVYDDDEIEDDYIAIGKRGDKCFIRIYLKSKEVVQMGYKGFFLQLWYLSGMISRYDLYCLEEAYKRKSWNYVNIARLEWALQYDDGLTDVDKQMIRNLLEADKQDINAIRRAAKKFTPEVTKIFNIEFQCMRDMSKSFDLIQKNEGKCARVYDYLDNFELIYEYLTRVSMRLVRTDSGDSNKQRRANCEFWERLRKAKTVDFKKKHKDIKLLRKYTSNVNLEIRKKRAISSLSSFGYSLSQDVDGNILDDASRLISILNDNDLDYIDKHKKKLKSRNAEVIPDEQKAYRDVFIRFISNSDN